MEGSVLPKIPNDGGRATFCRRRPTGTRFMEIPLLCASRPARLLLPSSPPDLIDRHPGPRRSRGEARRRAGLPSALPAHGGARAQEGERGKVHRPRPARPQSAPAQARRRVSVQYLRTLSATNNLHRGRPAQVALPADAQRGVKVPARAKHAGAPATTERAHNPRAAAHRHPHQAG